MPLKDIARYLTPGERAQIERSIEVHRNRRLYPSELQDMANESRSLIDHIWRRVRGMDANAPSP